MIVEALIGGVTVCLVSSFWFARWCIKHEAAYGLKKPKSFRREVLEGALKEWHGKTQHPFVQDRIKELERQLIELDDD